jgi:type IV pilus assembly protein PilP
VRITATVLALALLALFGCKGDNPVGPSNEEFAQARAELVAKMQKRKGKAEKGAGAAQPAAAAAPAGPTFASVEQGFHYDPKGKRDPFRSFEWEQLKLEFDDAARGPLEQFDVSQLTLLGVVWNQGNSRALIEDPSGMTYIVAEGAKIGKNEGRVIQIGDNLVVVKETYVDFLGEETTKDIEMRIRATEGG